MRIAEATHNAAAQVLGVVIKMSEVLHQGPAGLHQEGDTLRVIWHTFGVKESFRVNFTFYEEGDVKAWEEIADPPALTEYQRAELTGKVKAVFDYIALKGVGAHV